MRHRLQLFGLLLRSLLFLWVTGADEDKNVIFLKCPIGFGRDGSPERVIPEEWINDGYCDCPMTGEDEPLTNACAGIEYWPGKTSTATDDDNDGSGGSSDDNDDQKFWFQCPQQSDLRVPPSKLNDGICDCCDGADEPISSTTATCEDFCEELLAEARAERQRLELSFSAGSKKRNEQVVAFASLVEEVSVQIEQYEAELKVVDEQWESNHALIEESKSRTLNTRLSEVSSRSLAIATTNPMPEVAVDEGLKGLFEPLSTDEIVWFIIHACQIAGEMESASSDKSCVPLRLAGLDSGITWQPKSYKLERMDPSQPDSEEKKKELANILHHNMRNAKKAWNGSEIRESSRKLGDSKMRRRLDDVHDDDHVDYDGDLDHGHDDYVPSEDDEEHEEEGITDDDYTREQSHRTRRHRNIPNSDQEDEGNAEDGSRREELEEIIRGQPLSRTRISFLGQQSILMERIEVASKDAPSEDKDLGDEVDQEETGEEEVVEKAAEEKEDTADEKSEKISFDPLALPMVRNRLESLQKRVKRGIDYAVSAKVLLDVLEAWSYESDEQRRGDLYRLAVGTLNHGKLSTLHVWQIFQSVVPELVPNSDGSGNETCRSPWAGSCPPRTVDRSVGTSTVKIPPEAVVRAGESFCDKQYDELVVEAACAGTLVKDDTIPSEIPDGFMGYYEVRPREDDDPLAEVLRPLDLESDSQSKEELGQLIDEDSKLEGERNRLKRDVTKLKDSIGSDNPGKFGPDGELHSLQKTCFDVDTGKYTYELCLFGSAAQKDTGQKGRGTDLGKWTGPGKDEETGKRIWKWENGSRCWNGPSRSATAYVTCGEETIILSADEPEMCRYVMEMESYLACDEDFGTRHGVSSNP